jgi:hypothetical protein
VYFPVLKVIPVSKAIPVIKAIPTLKTIPVHLTIAILKAIHLLNKFLSSKLLSLRLSYSILFSAKTDLEFTSRKLLYTNIIIDKRIFPPLYLSSGQVLPFSLG